jgi:hypothetical protein
MVAVDAHALPLVYDFDVLATLLAADELQKELFVGCADRVQGDAGEHHAPAVGRIPWILLDNMDAVFRMPLLEQVREVQAGGAATDHQDLHRLLRHPETPVASVRDGRLQAQPLERI